MIKIFGPKVKVGCKDNVFRVAEKIQEIMHEKNIPAGEAWGHMTDVCRLQIHCKTP